MTTDAAELNRQLEEARRELSEVREALVELPIAQYRAVLLSYLTLKPGDRAGGWVDEIADGLVTMYTPPRDISPDPLRVVRVLCPLCGDGGEHINGEVGFVYPEGLRRHLAGEMNARMCEVVKAAKGLASGHLKKLEEGRHG